jgi:hypothetical protein
MVNRILLLLVLLSLAIGNTSFAQTEDSTAFCGKKWYCEMTKDADGVTHPPEAGTEKDFMDFRCDSTFELAENGIVLKGTWLYNEETRTIKLTQTQMDNIPESFSFHIIDSDEGHLVIIGQEGTTNEETAYFYTK